MGEGKIKGGEGEERLGSSKNSSGPPLSVALVDAVAREDICQCMQNLQAVLCSRYWCDPRVCSVASLFSVCLYLCPCYGLQNRPSCP